MRRYLNRRKLVYILTALLLGAALLPAARSVVPLAYASPPPGVEPQTVNATLKEGKSTTVAKTVHTPTIPPRPDIVFLSDTTGSMGLAIASVRTNAIAIMNAVLAAQPDAQFGAAEYKDADGCGDPFAYRLDQAITANTVAVQNGINL